jgi:hypothetical protein
MPAGAAGSRKYRPSISACVKRNHRKRVMSMRRVGTSLPQPMLREVLRWLHQRGASVGERWLAWTKALMSRHLCGRQAAALLQRLLPPGQGARHGPWGPHETRHVWDWNVHVTLDHVPNFTFGKARQQDRKTRAIVVSRPSTPPLVVLPQKTLAPVSGGAAQLFRPSGAAGPEPGFVGNLVRPGVAVDYRSPAPAIGLSTGALEGGAAGILPNLPAALVLPQAVAMAEQMTDKRRRVEERNRSVATLTELATALETHAARPATILPPQPGRGPITVPENLLPALASAARGAEGRNTKPPQPAFDVERLTEQVVRQIDQRIIALRERMGKAF